MEVKGLRRKLFSVTIKDCKVDTFTVSGHGGAGKDTSNSGVRITHIASCAIGKCGEHRSQLKNKQIAFRRMAESKEFKTWLRVIIAELSSGKTLEQKVEEEMEPQKLKVEARTEKGWEVVS